MAAQQMGGGSGYAAGAPPYGPTVISEVPPPPAVIVAPAYRPLLLLPASVLLRTLSPLPAHGRPRRVLIHAKRRLGSPILV